VESWLEDLLWEKKSNMDIYRCKGVLHIHNSNQLHTLQVVTAYKASERIIGQSFYPVLLQGEVTKYACFVEPIIITEVCFCPHAGSEGSL
jgi:hypothetical protein